MVVFVLYFIFRTYFYMHTMDIVSYESAYENVRFDSLDISMVTNIL